MLKRKELTKKKNRERKTIACGFPDAEHIQYIFLCIEQNISRKDQCRQQK